MRVNVFDSLWLVMPGILQSYGKKGNTIIIYEWGRTPGMVKG